MTSFSHHDLPIRSCRHPARFRVGCRRLAGGNADHLLVRYVQAVGYRRSPGSAPLRFIPVCRGRMPLWSALVVSLLVAHHHDDRPLRRSFHVPGPTGASLVRAAFLVVWLPLDVRGFRPVLACAWHDAFWMQTAKPSRRSGAFAWYNILTKGRTIHTQI
jgi:hypothetical protein